MSRILILIVSLVWASLLLVSWGSTAETGTPQADPTFAKASVFAEAAPARSAAVTVSAIR